MAKIIERLQSGTIVGRVATGTYGNQIGSVKQCV